MEPMKPSQGNLLLCCKRVTNPSFINGWRPPIEIVDAFEHTVARRACAVSLLDCFHTVDGQNALDALLDLCNAGLSHNLPIILQ